MGLHKIVQEGGEAYLPFALSKMRRLQVEADANFGTANRVIWADDGARIRLSINGTEQHLHITAGDVKYQFACSGEFVRKSALAGTSFELTHCYAVQVDLDKGALKCTPMGSTVEPDPRPDPAKPARWPFSADAQDVSEMFAKKNLWQIDCIPQFAYYRKGASKTGAALIPALVSSWSANKPVVGMLSASGVPDPLEGAIDLAFDAAPSLFRERAAGKPWGEIGAAPDADWYRRAALHKATHPDHGSRNFIVMVDVSNRFYVYPTSADIDPGLYQGAPPAYKAQEIKTNVPGKFVKSEVAPLPAWCRKPLYASRDSAPDARNQLKNMQYVLDVPQYIWQFDSRGKRACCIVYEDLPAIAMSNGQKPLLEGVADDGKEVREALPGLVEIEVQVTLTGTKPEDFSVRLVTVDAFRPSQDGRYFVGAAYAWKVPPPPLPQGAPVPAVAPPNTADLDDMLVITGHVYHTSSERERLGSTTYEPRTRVSFDPFAAKCLLRVQNLTKRTVVRSFVVRNTNARYISDWLPVGVDRWPTDKPACEATGVLIAHDLRILAFAVQQKYLQYEWRLTPAHGAIIDSRSQTQRVEVYAYNRLVEQKLLDPASPLNGALHTMFEQTSAAGLHEFPISAVGEFNTREDTSMANGRDPAQSVYTVLGLYPLYNPSLSDWGYRTAGGNGSYLPVAGNFHAGALAYAQMIYPAVGAGSSNARESFTVHPDGSWSFASAPFVYFAGPQAWLGRGEDVDLSLMRQGMVDILVLRKGGKDTRTSHLECFNKAFDKSLTQADFLYQFGKHTSTAPGGLFLRFLRMTPGADPQASPGVNFEAYIPIGDSKFTGGSRLVPADLFAIDMRRPVAMYMAPPAISPVSPGYPYAGYNVDSQDGSLINPRTPFTRGSSLFF